jgi:hypothetical protein
MRSAKGRLPFGIESEMVPQTDRARLDEFLKLDLTQTNSVAVRNRAKRAAMLRLG